MSATALDRAGLARLLQRPGVWTCLDALAAEGEETRLVGGCVRDALLGREVADIDLATTLVPGQVMERAGAAGIKAVPTGFEHGTVTLIVGGAPFETTTLREDIETDGRHAVVRFGRDFARDAERRDFTINALSLSPDGRLHDTTGGVADLADGRVRFIGDAATRIREDALRILRFFRFHARYGSGEPDRSALAAIVSGRAGLDRLSRERVRGEILRLLIAPGAVAAIRTMAEIGLVARVLATPGAFGRLRRVQAFEERHGLPPDGVRRLAALAVFSPEDAGRLEASLRLSRAETMRLLGYARAAAVLHAASAPFETRILRRLAAERGLAALEDALAALDGEAGPSLGADARSAMERFRSSLEAVPVLPLAGSDLIAAGVRSGPALGEGLAAARRVWLDEGCPTDPDARSRLLAIARAASGRATQNESDVLAS